MSTKPFVDGDPPRESLAKDPRRLVNKLTVGDARRLLRHEGGPWSGWTMAWRAGLALALIGLTARAIGFGEATIWHLMLPLMAQLVALNACLPLMIVGMRASGLRREAWACWRNVVIGLAAAAVAIFVRSRLLDASWTDQAGTDLRGLWAWIVDHEMQWPTLLALAGMAASLPARVRQYQQMGPPFVSVSFGCAAQAVVMTLGLFALPLLWGHPTGMTWALWSALSLADLLALYGLWDVQRRLRQLDARDSAPKSAGSHLERSSSPGGET